MADKKPLLRRERSDIRRRAYIEARELLERLTVLLDADLVEIALTLGAEAALDDDEVRRVMAARLTRLAEELE